MKKAPISLLLGLSGIVITVILYFLILRNSLAEVICLISLFCVILAELFTTGLAYFSNCSPRKTASVFVSALMIPFAVILSIVYIVNFPEGYVNYILIYILGLIIINAIAIVLFTFDASRNRENATVQNNKNSMLYLRNTIKCIMADPAAKNYLKELNAIEEMLHFTNDSIIAEQDAIILASINTIKQNISNPNFNTIEALSNLKVIINERNIMHNLSKR